MEVALESIDVARLIVDLISDKKGEKIVLTDLRSVSSLTDFFVIGQADSDRQLNAIVDHIREEVKKNAQLLPMHVEGQGENGWVLMDYGDVVVHLFDPDLRAYYNL